MIKKTVSYTDWDGNPRTKDFYFNISKMELAENLDLKDEIDHIAQRISGAQRELPTEDIQAIFNMYKRFARLSYGVRDGEHFRKSEQIWDDFVSSPAYDEFLFTMIKNVEEGLEWLRGLLPQDLVSEAERLERDKNQPELPLGENKDAEVEGMVAVKPASEMSRDELLAALEAKTQS